MQGHAHMTNMRASNYLAVGVFAVIAFIVFFAPRTHAQTPEIDQLRATIRAEIMADPRSQELTEAQIQAMVNALSAEAVRQGVTASQLTARPTVQDNTLATDECAGVPEYLCKLNTAFGFLGSDRTIPIALFVVSTLFILLFSLMREIGHPHASLPWKK